METNEKWLCEVFNLGSEFFLEFNEQEGVYKIGVGKTLDI